jgi:hypothetical protein
VVWAGTFTLLNTTDYLVYYPSKSTGIGIVICGGFRVQLRASARGEVSISWRVVRVTINERRSYFCTILTKLNLVDRC